MNSKSKKTYKVVFFYVARAVVGALLFWPANQLAKNGTLVSRNLENHTPPLSELLDAKTTRITSQIHFCPVSNHTRIPPIWDESCPEFALNDGFGISKFLGTKVSLIANSLAGQNRRPPPTADKTPKNTTFYGLFDFEFIFNRYLFYRCKSGI